MKQYHQVITIAALALGLIATPAWANPFRVINDYGSEVEAMCHGDTTFSSLTNGTSTDFDCSAELVTRVDGLTSVSFAFECSSAQRQDSTVTQNSDGGADWDHACQTP